MSYLKALKSPPPHSGPVKNSGNEINRVTEVTRVTAAPVLAPQGNPTENGRVTKVTAQADNSEKVTQVTQPKTPGLPKKSYDLALVTEVTQVTHKTINPLLLSGLESIPYCPPDDADFWEWHGAIDLKEIARQYGLSVRRSVRGSIVVVYPAPVNVQLVEYADDCLRDCRGYLAKFPGIPTIPPAEALAEFRRMGGEVQHVQGGFVPVYPETWPGYVKDSAEALFLAAVDAIEAEDRQEVESAVRSYTGGNR